MSLRVGIDGFKVQSLERPMLFYVLLFWDFGFRAWGLGLRATRV